MKRTTPTLARVEPPVVFAGAGSTGELGVVDMRCVASAPGATHDWHSHGCFELVFVNQDGATLGAGGGQRRVEPDTLVLYRPGERHAAWSKPWETPRFWVLHFSAPPELMASFPRFNAARPEDRSWCLRAEQAEAFRRLYLQMLNERVRPQEFQAQAETAWLRLLLISVHRWLSGDAIESPLPTPSSPELLKLWHLVNASVGQPAEYLDRIHTFPNYDSLRHGFKRAFGCSPRAMMLRLRIQYAKQLLLQSDLSIKEIAARCGYQRQHEFARAFRQHAGFAPTQWRADPVLQPEPATAAAAHDFSRLARAV